MLAAPYGTPIGFAVKTPSDFSSSCPFTLPIGNCLQSPSCCSEEHKGITTTNEPVWAFQGHSFPWSSHESSFIDFSNQANALWSFLSTPTSSIRPPTSVGGERRKLDGGSCLFIFIRLVRGISLTHYCVACPCHFSKDWFMYSLTFPFEC